MKKLDIPVTAALTFGAAQVALAETAVGAHRVDTHDNTAFKNKRVERAFRILGAHLIDSKPWAAVHRIHHSWTDVNGVPFVELADFLDWHQAQTSRHEGQIEIPDTVNGFDPVLTELDVQEAREIGQLGRELVSGKYQAPTGYSRAEAERILYGQEARYCYEDTATMKHATKNPIKFDPNNLPPLHDIRFMLRDPHAPVLHRQGIPGVLWHNPGLYSYAEKNFRDPGMRPSDLQPDKFDEWAREHRKELRMAYVGGMALTHMALTRPKSAEEAAISAASGAAASGLAVVALLFGGNITNGIGHAGDLSKLSLRDFLEGKVHPKADGTYTTNNKALSLPTYDEVGGQQVHHERPDLIAYTLQETLPKQLVEAPFGTILKLMADRGIIFVPGSNFNGAALQDRPDVLSPPVLRIQELRQQRLANAA